MFKIVLNNPPQRVFFSGSEVSGMLMVEADEPTRKFYTKIEVTLVGLAHVSVKVSTQQGYHTYTSNETYINLSAIVWTKEQEPSREFHTGMHSFPFRFRLPAGRLPPSFRNQGPIRMFSGIVEGWIEYYVEGRIGTGTVDFTMKMPIAVVEVVDINVPQLQTPIHAWKQKTVSCLSCASAPITLSVELPRHGFCHGDIIPIKATLENGSRKRLNLTAQLLQIIYYTAEGTVSRNTRSIVAGIASGQLEPRTTSTWNPKELVVPAAGYIVPTLRSCGSIHIEYVLRVFARGQNLTVDIAVTIGNVPQRNSTSAPNPVPMKVQPEFVSPQPSSSTRCISPSSHQQFEPPKAGSTTEQSATP